MTEPVNASELLAVMASRQLRDDTTVFAGVGVPLLAAALAKQRHAPRLTMVIEGGIIGPQIAPGRLPVSTNEMRAGHRATMLPGITDAFLFAQRGFVDVGFMGGAQIDQYGNINTSAIGGDYWKPKVRLPGTGGANDIASLCREVIIVTPHEKRRFVERVDFITSPALARGRRFAGGGPVCSLAACRGSSPRSACSASIPRPAACASRPLHPGVSIDAIRAHTGFELLVAPEVTVDRASVARRAGHAASPRSRTPLPRLTRNVRGARVHVGLAIKNFVGPTETPGRRRPLGVRRARGSPRLRVAVGVGSRDPRRGARLPHPGRRGHPHRHCCPHAHHQARHRGLGATAAQSHGGGQGPRHPGRHLPGSAHPGGGGGLVRAGIRRGRSPVQATGSSVRAQPRHPHPAVDGGPGDPARGRVQPARGRHAPPARSSSRVHPS